MKQVNTPKLILSAVVLLALVWHLKIGMTSKINLVGLFMVKPAEGYTWMGIDNAESRFFWQDTDVKWQAGTPHTDYKAQSGATEGVWVPMPGYVFVDKSKSLQTVWKVGLRHPDYMALSDREEGQWAPVTGYRFIYDGDTFTDAVWDPNHRYSELKVVSLPEKDKYAPFPGYQFVSPHETLEVVWVPGTVNYENPKLIAGQQKDNWIVNSRPVSPRYRSGGKGLTPGQAFGLGVVVGGVVGSSIPRRVW